MGIARIHQRSRTTHTEFQGRTPLARVVRGITSRPPVLRLRSPTDLGAIHAPPLRAIAGGAFAVIAGDVSRCTSASCDASPPASRAALGSWSSAGGAPGASWGVRSTPPTSPARTPATFPPDASAGPPGDVRLVGLELLPGVPDGGVLVRRVLQLDDPQGQAVHEQDDVGAVRVLVLGDGDREPVVGRGPVEVDDLRLRPADGALLCYKDIRRARGAA